MSIEQFKKTDTNLIRVVVIDDSAFMRKSLSLMLESDPEIKVVAVARDGKEALEKIEKFQPDIATLDIEMPSMDGLTALKLIMENMPIPILMVSALTTEGAKITMDALELGAIDFIAKNLSRDSTNIRNIKSELIEKVKQIVRSRSIQTQFRMKRLMKSRKVGKSTIEKQIQEKKIKGISPVSLKHMKFDAALFAVSTGGPQALCNLIPNIPENFPIGVGIVQHMPPQFTKTLADRLNILSKIFVKEAEDGEVFERGKILIAPGGKQMKFRKDSKNVVVEISDEPVDAIYKPSADITITSAVSAFSGPLLGIIMTGMGRDGVMGLKKVKSKGGYVIAQDEDSCVIYGMPKAAVEEGIVDSIQSLENISQTLGQLSNMY